MDRPGSDEAIRTPDDQRSYLDGLLDRIAHLEHEVEAELNRARAQWRYHIGADRVRFEHDVRLAHQRLKQGIVRFFRDSNVATIATAPVIYSLIVPMVLLDGWVTLYQAICFRAYGIAPVRRSAYIVIDRQHLSYLNGIEKLNCMFCGYGTGVFAYVREVAGRTEQYWCPIRHAHRVRATHRLYRHFVDYGDAEGYRQRLIPLRNELRKKPIVEKP
ncbi:MAG: hypothetical protein ABJC89_25210 [Acidobacteriota bacterium]